MRLWHQLRRDAPAIPAWAPAQPGHHAAQPPTIEHAFAGWTAGFHVTGTVVGPDRLSDILNLRDYIRVRDAVVRPGGAEEADAEADGQSGATTAPEVVFDPFDFDFVVAEPLEDSPHRLDRRIHKLPYAVRVDGERFTIWGRVWVYPDSDPELAIRGSASLFIPITTPQVEHLGVPMRRPPGDAVLINRLAIRSLRRMDLTAEPPLLVSRPRRASAPGT